MSRLGAFCEDDDTPCLFEQVYQCDEQSASCEDDETPCLFQQVYQCDGPNVARLVARALDILSYGVRCWLALALSPRQVLLDIWIACGCLWVEVITKRKHCNKSTQNL